VCTNCFFYCFILIAYYLFGLVCLCAVGGDGNSIQAAVSKALQQVTGVGVNGDGLLLKGRDFWDKVKAAFALLLLKFERNVTDGSLGNPAHQMRGESGNLIAHALGRKNGNLINDALVGVEIRCQPWVILLHNRAGRLLHSLGSDTLHFTKTHIERHNQKYEYT
jgi:hypothetical protein